MKKCWICGDGNLSDEHKFKSSDLRRNYGRRYKGKNGLLYFSGERKGIELENYKDDLLKFKNCICINCNNNLTKPHDDAYDIFMDYIVNHYEKLITQGFIDFGEIFKETQKLDLYKYFAKHAGCKIVTGRIPFDIEELKAFIVEGKIPTSFMLHFEIKEGIKVIMDKLKGYYHLYNGPTNYVKLKSGNGFMGWTSYHWFTTNWFYSNEIDNRCLLTQNAIEPIKIKFLKDCISNENDLNIHRIEYCGLETLDEIINRYEKIAKKVYN